MRRTLARSLVVTAPLMLVAWTAFHLEVTASYPEADSVLGEAPGEVWLEFSVVPDGERTSFSVRGPDGDVSLGDITQGEGDGARVLRADVTGPMSAGSYTVSWVGAPPDDHPVRGRFSFSIEAGGAAPRQERPRDVAARAR